MVSRRDHGGYSHEVNVELKSITPRDAVIETRDGSKLEPTKSAIGGTVAEVEQLRDEKPDSLPRKRAGATAASRRSSRTHPLFPPLPTYGAPTLPRNIRYCAFRFSSFFLSLAFLGMIVVAASVTSFALMFKHIWMRITFWDPDARRPFYQEEVSRRTARREAEREWKRREIRGEVDIESEAVGEEFEPLEDGFVITLWHVYDPKEYTPASESERAFRGPDVFTAPGRDNTSRNTTPKGRRKYPVLLVHGLLQSAGAYCTNDDESLAFFLCKSGYDVWLGNRRCGFQPEHTTMTYSDPRMWAWNIRQMGVFDLPALVSRVLFVTGFQKVGLVCHSQGTTQALVAFSRGQRPGLGEKISVFCGLAPAAYAGPLIGKVYFKFMRIISSNMFRLVFGIHAFIPFMMTMHSVLPGRVYGTLGYHVFSFLFNWTDERWDRDLRDRMFQFSPVYVSSESMRWWLGRKCFARHKCILATKDEWRREETEDRLFVEATGETEATLLKKSHHGGFGGLDPANSGESSGSGASNDARSESAWYNEQTPPFAFWVAGSDNLVDGRRLLRRFENGREPHVRVVHAEVIEEYEHLDVIWAMDSIEKVGKGVRDIIWKTISEEDRASCCVPRDCEGL